VIVRDASGRVRPEWAAAFREPSPRLRRAAEDVVGEPDWVPMIRRLGALLDHARRPHALAAIAVRPVV
jgi:hypothetical protein